MSGPGSLTTSGRECPSATAGDTTTLWVVTERCPTLERLPVLVNIVVESSPSLGWAFDVRIPAVLSRFVTSMCSVSLWSAGTGPALSPARPSRTGRR